MVNLFNTEGNIADAEVESPQQDNHEESQQHRRDFGGHSLRTTIRPTHEAGRRPRSVLAFQRTQHNMEAMQSTLTQGGVLQFVGPGGQTYYEASPTRQAIQMETLQGDERTSYDEDDEEDNDSSDPDDIQYVRTNPIPKQTANVILQPSATSARQPPTDPTRQPFQGITIPPTSELGHAAARAHSVLGAPTAAATDLAWQAAVAGEKQKLKEFRTEALQRNGLTVFAFLRPGSPHIQLLHAMGNYNGDETDGGETSDYGFVGDRRDAFRQPTPVHIPDKAWTWTTRKLIMDITVLEEFYATPANKHRLYHQSTKGGEQRITVPRLLFIPPEVVAFCIEGPRTPFELHQFVTKVATRGDGDTLNEWQLVFDWCFVASHYDATATTTSMVALTLHNAPTHDDQFVEWLQVLLYKSFGIPGDSEQTTQRSTASTRPLPRPAPVPPPPQQARDPGRSETTHVHWQQTAQNTEPLQTQFAPVYPSGFPSTPPGLPPPPADMWAHIAANLTQGIASMAAAIAPTTNVSSTSADPSTLYDHGGRDYDEFQVAVLKGFAHTTNIGEIPAVWPHFQRSKHIEGHRDHIRRKMLDWARNTKPDQVQIDRGLYIPSPAIKDILALRFNPGGPTAEVATADQGLSILICRPLTAEGKAALRRREQLEATTKRRTLAEAELELTQSEPTMLPDNYSELHVCLGTYCALLHALFGERCVFYKHCFRLWTTMASEAVYDHRHLFTPVFCRQLVWAIIEYSRAYFAQRMSVDDFVGVHPGDIIFPRSNLIELEPILRTQTMLLRSSFPERWNPGSTQSFSDAGTTAFHTVVGGSSGVTVVSGVTTGSTKTQKPKSQAKLRQTNIHPLIKTAMEPYFKKVQGIRLLQMLSHCNLTVDDLPSLQSSGASNLCYNFILGYCNNPTCTRLDGHVAATDISDEFATELLQKLRPAMNEFIANGAPRRPKRRRQT